MKKSLIALAVLGSMVGAASAQSSVTLFGVVDLNLRYNKAAGVSTQTLGTDGITSSRLGFRGVEDLGGGLKASFWLEHRYNPDAGTLNSSGKFWHGRSTVSLSGDFGEVRLGRYLSPTWNGFADFDPFGTNGVGDVSNMYKTLGANGGTSGTNKTRMDNAVGYFLPGGLGGIYGEFALAAGEGTDGNKYVGGRLGYADGPVNVSFASGGTNSSTSKYRSTSLGGSYDFGVVKLLGTASQLKYFNRKASIYTLGLTAPVGNGTFKVAYTNVDANTALETAVTAQGDASLLAVGYVYDLSKRTALYSTASKITNKGKSTYSMPGTPSTLKAGGDAGAVEVGIRHAF